MGVGADGTWSGFPAYGGITGTSFTFCGVGTGAAGGVAWAGAVGAGAVPGVCASPEANGNAARPNTETRILRCTQTSVKAGIASPSVTRQLGSFVSAVRSTKRSHRFAANPLFQRIRPSFRCHPFRDQLPSQQHHRINRTRKAYRLDQRRTAARLRSPD